MRKKSLGEICGFSDARIRLVLMVPLIVLLFASCKKDKIDLKIDNRAVTDSRANSTARIVNLAGYNQVKIGEDSLTNFIVRNPNSLDYNRYPRTHYFPIDGRLGKIWSIPRELFDQQDRLHVEISHRGYQGLMDRDLLLDVTNNHQEPTDHYLLPTVFMDGQPEVVAVKRDVTAPSKPDYIKIRIVNFTGKIKNLALNSSGTQEELHGNVSLAYADGTPVSVETSDVSTTQMVSEYIEIPYGTYQFRVLTDNGRQLPAIGSEIYEYKILDPPTSTIPLGLLTSTNQVFTPIQTYQPGGIYTIVVTPQEFRYYTNDQMEDAGMQQNAFQIISDNSPSANLNFFKVQGVNAWADRPVHFRVNGQSISSALGFGSAGEYHIGLHGTHTVEAVDAAGQVIAKIQEQFRHAQNYTVWLYPNPAGQAKLLLLANDLSGSWYRGAEDDATYTRYQYKYFFFRRFLNLSPDNSYITFTTNHGQTSSGTGGGDAGVNLQPGVPIVEEPYVLSNYRQSMYEIMTYRSRPNVVPGIWADDIDVVSSQDMIARTELYTRAGRALPAHEPGIYSICLIGNSNGTGPKARIMILKHNK